MYYILGVPAGSTELEMNRHLASAVLALLLVGICQGQKFEGIVTPIRDVPFSAEIRHTYTTSNSRREWFSYIARASNGSLYFASASDARPLEVLYTHVAFEDAACNCRVDFFPVITPQIKITSREEDASSAQMTVDGIRQSLKDLQQRFTEEPVSTIHGEIHRASLGEQNIDGMTLFGIHMDTTPDSKNHAFDGGRGSVQGFAYRKKYAIDDIWDSELGFRYSWTSTEPSTGIVSDFKVTHFNRGEPDPALSRLQDRYFPPVNSIRSATKIFISHSNIGEDLRERIESILTTSGHYTVVRDLKAADLSIQFASSHVTSAKDRATWITLRLSNSKGKALANVALLFPDAEKKWAELPVVNTCFANVWNQIENVSESSGSIRR